MKKYVVVRALYSVITLWLLVTIVFALVRLSGDPVAKKGEIGADPTYLQQIRHDWGLDRPVYLQYVDFIANLARDDFGHSFEKSLPVSDDLFCAAAQFAEARTCRLRDFTGDRGAAWHAVGPEG